MGAIVSTGAILFTDMVGSTELRSRLGDDRAETLRKHHDDLLATAVATHHGTVLRWTGDGIKAAFPTASDAVAAAVDMQRSVLAYGTDDRAVAAFQVRIGLGAGELMIDDGDHHGVAVIEAARLEAMARPGEILATDVVRALGHRRANVAFEEVGERRLKGLDRPVMVHRVIDLAGGAAPALPRLLVADQGLPLVGREEQIARFGARWSDATHGTAGLLLVRGRPGLGKTRLVAHCAELAHADGAIVMAGVCDRDLGVPYEPFAAAFREVARLDESLESALTTAAGPLARLFPGSTSSHAETQPAMARFELFEATVTLVRRLTKLHPVLLVLDDLQWSTAPTVLLLRHLVQELDDTRLLVMAAYRDDDLEPSHPLRELLAGVRTSPRAEHLDLQELSTDDVIAMVAAAAPTVPAGRVAAIAELVHQESAGSPFFTSELLRHLAATGELERLPDIGPTTRLPTPDSVHEVVTQRIARLPAGAHEILSLAAVVGPVFDLDLLADVVGRSADDVLDLLDQACRAGMVAEVGVEQFAFAHAIVRTALLDAWSPTRRARAHRRVAEALEARGAEQFDELAHHWRLAGMEAKSITHLARAARRDMVALAFESARARYQEVVDLLSRDAHADVLMRAEAWLGLGAAERALQDPSFKQAVSRAARLARTARHPALMAEAAALSAWPGTFFFTAGLPDTDLIELCEDALGLLDATDPLRPRVLATLASHLTFASDRERRAEIIEEARWLASHHGDPALVAMVLNAEFVSLWEPETLARREQIGRELGRIARATGDAEIEFLGGFFTAYCLVESGEPLAGRARLLELEPVIDVTKNQYFAFLADRLLISIDILLGEPGIQERVDGLLQRFGATHADTDGSWALQTGGLSYYAGTLHSMINAIEAMTASPLARTWTAALALARFWAGDAAGAAALIDDDTPVPKNYFWTTVVQVRAEVAAGLGRPDLCRALFDDLLPFRGRIGITASGSLCYGLVSRSLGMLACAVGDVPLAVDLLTEAVAHADRIGAPFESVIGRRLLAEALLTSGDDAELVGPMLLTARELAARHGFARELEEIDGLGRIGAASERS